MTPICKRVLTDSNVQSNYFLIDPDLLPGVMLIYCTTVDIRGDYTVFSFDSSSIDECLDAVSKQVYHGLRLVHVELIEGHQSTYLPTDAFDGHSMKIPLEQLRRQWEQILGKS